jgi:hypothetical protein
MTERALRSFSEPPAHLSPTATLMPTDLPSHPPDRETEIPYFMAFIVCILGCLIVLVGLALPAHLVSFPTSSLREKIPMYGSVRKSAADVLNVAREQAEAWRASAETFDNTTLASLFRVSHKSFDNPDAKPLIQEGMEWQKQAMNPFDTYGWSQLAQLYLKSEGTVAEAAASLRKSIETAPSEQKSITSHFEVLAQFLDTLDQSLKDRLVSIIRTTWSFDPEGVSLAAQQDHFTGMVEQALSDQPDELAKFHKLIDKKRL